MMQKAKTTLVFLTALLVAGAASASDRWLHVKIEGNDEEKVTVNLPLSLMEAAVQMIPEEVTADINADVQVAIDDVDMSWQDLRNFWQAVKDTDEATFATVESRDEKIVVKKEGEFLLVKTTELNAGGAEIDVEIPMSVVDGLFSGPEGTLNFSAAIQALADHDSGHLVSIRDGDETVKIWIDDVNQAD